MKYYPRFCATLNHFWLCLVDCPSSKPFNLEQLPKYLEKFPISYDMDLFTQNRLDEVKLSKFVEHNLVQDGKNPLSC